MSATCYVYEHYRPDTGACFYVGKGTRKNQYARCFDFKRAYCNRHHASIVVKLAAMGLEPQVCVVACGLTEADAHALEIERIAYHRAAGVELTNQTNGGDGISGAVRSVETRAKQSAALKGLPAWNKGLPSPLKGRPSPLKGKPGHPAWNRGKTPTEATRARLSAAAKARCAKIIISAEARAARKAQWRAQLAAQPEMAAT